MKRKSSQADVERRNPFVIDHDNCLLLDAAESGIHPLILMYDGIGMIRYHDDDRTFLTAESVANWHEKEHAESRGTSGNLEIATALRELLRKVVAGEVEINENP